MYLRRKLTLMFLLLGLIAATTVGGVAYWMLMQDFRQAVMDEAFENFKGDMVAYLEHHGSWEQGIARQSFHQFVMERRRARPLAQLPPPEDGPLIDRRGSPPFLFLIMTPEGRILKGIDGYQVGDQAPDSLRNMARPIEVRGVVSVLASPIGEVRLTRRDQGYLNAMQQALVTGIVVAILLAVAAGLIMGQRMGGALTRLIHAVRGMQEDREALHPVPVESRDEIGQLADAFNQMNSELSQAHRELRESSQVVESQAAQLRELSIRDPLTDLYNRRYFDEQFRVNYQQAKRYNHPITVMVGDLDHFKSINDNYSHAVGDQVLKRIASILATGTRKSDVVARFGGEEFAILFPQSSIDQASRCCEELRLRIETHPWHEIEPNLSVTISMGLCDEVALGSEEKMLNAADKRLYMAKSYGRNRVIPAAVVAV